jgi:hypothetical protein
MQGFSAVPQTWGALRDDSSALTMVLAGFFGIAP